MPKIKVPRKSTNIDMTAMCDVAFLLLAFFILTTSFKPDEEVEVTTPKSVSTRILDAENVVLVTMDKEGRVFFSVGDDSREEKEEIIEEVNQMKNLGLTDAEKAAFLRSGTMIGVPFSQLKSYLQLPKESLKNFKAPGIPVTDTLNNELQVWVRAAVSAFQGGKMALLVKGDNQAKYASFKGVIDAFKKNEQLKFSMITDPEGVPEGTELFRKQQALGKKATDAQ